MASPGGEEPPPYRGQSDSRLKSKKPPSLVIAIPPPEEGWLLHDPAKEVGSPFGSCPSFTAWLEKTDEDRLAFRNDLSQ